MPAKRKYFTAEARAEANRESRRRWAQRNREKRSEYDRMRYLDPAVKARKAELRRKRKPTQEQRIKRLAYQREYLRLHPEKARLFAANKNHRRRQATDLHLPKWTNRFFMEEAYDLARRRTRATGFAWHVDHVVPLRSKIVSGLHCEQNLQVIPARVNSAKRNRFWPDMPTDPPK